MKAKKLFALLPMAVALLMGMSSCDEEEDVTSLYQQLNGKWFVESTINILNFEKEDLEDIRDTIDMTDANNIFRFFNDNTITITDGDYDIEGTYEYLPEISRLILDMKDSGYGRRMALLRYFDWEGQTSSQVEFVDENTLKLSHEYVTEMSYEDLYYDYGYEEVTEDQLESDEALKVNVRTEFVLKRVTE